jgi:hypothetical protein
MILAFVLAAAFSLAQPAVISGTVVDADTRRPLPGAIVDIEGTTATTTTDINGRYTLSVPAGRLTIRVLMVGFGLSRHTITVAAGESQTLDVTIAAGTAPANETVVVRPDTYGRRDGSVAGEFQLKGGDLLALRGVLADDPFRAVQSAPSTTAGDDFRAEFAVRGNGPRQLGLTLDGIDSRLLMHAVRGVEDTGSLAMFNTDVLEGATLTTGAAPIRNRSRIGASLDFGLRDGNRSRFSARAAISGTSASLVAEGPLGPRASILVVARRSYLDWLLRKIDPETDETFGFADGLARLAWTPTNRHTLRVTLIGGCALLTNHDDNPGPNALDTGRGHTVGAHLEWQVRWSRGQLTQQATILDAEYRNEVRGGRGTREAGSDLELSWRADSSVTVGTTLRLEGGVRADRFRVDRRASTFTAVSSTELFRVSGRSTAQAAWGQLTWSPSARGELSAGTRVERWTTSGTTWSPWVTARVTATDGLDVRAGASLRHQHPDAEEQLFGVNQLTPERAWLGDLGLEWRPSQNWRAQVTGWVRQERNGLLFTGLPRVESGAIVEPAGVLDNRLQEDSKGIEFLLQRRIATGLTGWLGYALGHTRATDTISRERFDGDYDQRHGLSAWLSWRPSPRWSAQLRWRHSTNTPIVGYVAMRDGGYWLSEARNQERLPMYSRLDVRLDRAFLIGQGRLTLFAEVINVFNRTNAGPGDWSIRRSTGQVRDLTEDLFPLLPSIGLLFEF